MKYLHIAIFSLVLVALASGQANYTCVGNPYFTQPFMPNPVTLTVPDKAILDAWNITYDPTTQIYNLSNYKNLTLCQSLKTTGSCCTPDVLTQNARAFQELLDVTSDEALKLFEMRANALQSFGKDFGKITSNVINLISRLHGDGFKILLKAKTLFNNQTLLDQILNILNSTDLDTQLDNLTNSTSYSYLLKKEILSLVYQILNAISDAAGVKKADIAELFSGIKMLFLGSNEPSKLVDLWNPFPSVSDTLYSDTMDAILSMFQEIAQRTIRITMNIVSPDVAAAAKLVDSSGNLTLDVPYLLDSRNIENAAKAILTAIGNAANANEAFKNVLNNKETIYKNINDTFISNMTNLADFKAGGDWVNVRTLFITLGKFTFDDALKKVVSVAENKKECLKYVFQYQGFVGCLACDPSAVALGRIKLDRVLNTFDTIISEAFGNKMFLEGKCTDYYRDIIFMDIFMLRLRILQKLYENHQIAQVDVSKVDADPLNSTIPSNKSLDLSDFPNCASNATDCDEIRDYFIDSIGPKVSFLCDYDLEDCDKLDVIRATINPFMNKTNNNVVLDTARSFGNVSLSSKLADVISDTDVGFNTKPNFTVPTDLISNVAVNTAQENNTDIGSAAGMAVSPMSQTIRSFAVKLVAAASLILATIISTLL